MSEVKRHAFAGRGRLVLLLASAATVALYALAAGLALVLYPEGGFEPTIIFPGFADPSWTVAAFAFGITLGVILWKVGVESRRGSTLAVFVPPVAYVVAGTAAAVLTIAMNGGNPTNFIAIALLFSFTSTFQIWIALFLSLAASTILRRRADDATR
ncbi:hypothetical protein [Humidisolicoccus flavus]|uniref:hypothetical protein n=1 Tax=Humidisolicoccus flavus TaxID=3111414 RepID=UPI003246B84F